MPMLLHWLHDNPLSNGLSSSVTIVLAQAFWVGLSSLILGLWSCRHPSCGEGSPKQHAWRHGVLVWALPGAGPRQQGAAFLCAAPVGRPPLLRGAQPVRPRVLLLLSFSAARVASLPGFAWPKACAHSASPWQLAAFASAHSMGRLLAGLVPTVLQKCWRYLPGWIATWTCALAERHTPPCITQWLGWLIQLGTPWLRPWWFEGTGLLWHTWGF